MPQLCSISIMPAFFRIKVAFSRERVLTRISFSPKGPRRLSCSQLYRAVTGSCLFHQTISCKMAHRAAGHEMVCHAPLRENNVAMSLDGEEFASGCRSPPRCLNSPSHRSPIARWSPPFAFQGVQRIGRVQSPFFDGVQLLSIPIRPYFKFDVPL